MYFNLWYTFYNLVFCLILDAVASYGLRDVWTHWGHRIRVEMRSYQTWKIFISWNKLNSSYIVFSHIWRKTFYLYPRRSQLRSYLSRRRCYLWSRKFGYIHQSLSCSLISQFHSRNSILKFYPTWPHGGRVTASRHFSWFRLNGWKYPSKGDTGLYGNWKH